MAKFFMKKNLFLFYVLAFGLPCAAFGELQKNWEIVTVDNEAVYFLGQKFNYFVGRADWQGMATQKFSSN